MTDLWRHRADTPLEDYELGPGDEVTISVPEVEELQNQKGRISQDGTLSLPLLGTVDVGGLTEDQARQVMVQRLSKYMKVPRVEMYVDRYRSRGVAVAGAVQKPGVYDLATFGDSLDDVLAMAGGPTQSSAQRAIIFPVGITQSGSSITVDKPAASALPTPVSASTLEVPGATTESLRRRVAIAVPLGRQGDAGCLDMPARPGDIILIPTAGTVTVYGWVRNPGSFPITPGMTVLGAVTAAGGAIFTWHSQLLRTDQQGTRVVKEFSLSDLEDGTATDVPVESGDVVLVEKSVVGAVPYLVWEVFNRFGAGVGFGL